jgi:hypothetical protein
MKIEWNKVSPETMPNEKGYYLCYSKKTNSKVIIRRGDESQRGSGIVFWINGVPDKSITHWSVLPDAPE